MTYRDWDEADRSNTRHRAVSEFLAGNPWLSEEFFARQKGK